MKTIHLITLGLLTGSLTASAQFNSGSTGADGALHITTNTTLDLPANGIFNFTTITVETNATLRFNRNARNTPVYLLATGNVIVRGTIDVSGTSALLSPTNEPGRGGPGGFDGGWPGFGGNAPGSGHGPGGGKGGFDYAFGIDPTCFGIDRSAGYGAYAEFASGHYLSTNRGNLYGSPLLIPLLGGSGGGGTIGSPGVGGGGGGGAILIAANLKIDISGIVRADGGRGHINGCRTGSGGTDVNPGSGGAIRLVAPAVMGSGLLSAAGPIYAPDQAIASLGRIRIDSIDHRFMNFSRWGATTFGNYMVVFPATVPRLDLIDVAGTAIPEGSNAVTIQLPNGSNTNRTVTVQARNFNNIVPIEVVLTPQNGPRVVYTNVIDNASDNPATITVNVGLPVSTPVTVSAWTRVP